MAKSAESRENLLRFFQATHGPIIAIISTSFAQFFFQTRHALRPRGTKQKPKSSPASGFRERRCRAPDVTLGRKKAPPLRLSIASSKVVNLPWACLRLLSCRRGFPAHTLLASDGRSSKSVAALGTAPSAAVTFQILSYVGPAGFEPATKGL